jgi:uncharacterized Zn finger protein
VTIAVQPLSEAQWAQVFEALAAHPIFVAQLLAGEMPQDIEEAFSSVKLSLFPTSARDITQECNCPDWADVCKHLAAVHYILAERFDEDPFLLFSLRGKSQAEILEALRQLAGNQAGEADADVPAYEPPPPLSVADFWTGEAQSIRFQTHIAPPDSPYPVLARLGDPAFFPQIGRWLKPAYDGMSETAVSAAFTENNLLEEKENNDALE